MSVFLLSDELKRGIEFNKLYKKPNIHIWFFYFILFTGFEVLLIFA